MLFQTRNTPFTSVQTSDEQAHDQQRAEGRGGHPAVGGGRDPIEPRDPLAVDLFVMLGFADFLRHFGRDAVGRQIGDALPGA